MPRKIGGMKLITATPPPEVNLAAEVFDDAGACSFLVTNPRMLRKMRREYGLPFIRISSKSLRYKRKDLEAWLAARRVALG